MPDQINLAHVYCDRSALRANEDVAIFTCHWRGVAAGTPDDWITMDHAARQNATNKLRTFLDAIKAGIDGKFKFDRVRWYAVPDSGPAGPAIEEIPFTPVVTGTAAGGCLPPQIACSVTFRTAVRKNWGRFYIPGLGMNTVGTDGALTSTWSDAIATAAAVLTHRGASNTETLTVWSPTEQTRHDPQQVVVDDVLDVIRSRRFSSTLRRKIVAAG